jgi:hypothetical protein
MSKVTVEEMGTKMALITCTGNDKTVITIILSVLAGKLKLPPYIILQKITMLKEKLLAGQVFWCQEKS